MAMRSSHAPARRIGWSFGAAITEKLREASGAPAAKTFLLAPDRQVATVGQFAGIECSRSAQAAAGALPRMTQVHDTAFSMITHSPIVAKGVAIVRTAGRGAACSGHSRPTTANSPGTPRSARAA